MKVFAHLATAALWLLCGAAPAQTVWRCGADGRIYSQQPCAEGRPVSTGDSRPTEDVAQARQVAQRERALADEMRQARLQREAQTPAGAGLASLGPVSPPHTLRQTPAHHKSAHGTQGQNARSTKAKGQKADGKTPPNSFTALSTQRG